MIDIIPVVLKMLGDDAQFMAAVGGRLYYMNAPNPVPNTAYLPDAIVYPVTGTPSEGLRGTGPPWTQRVAIDVRSENAGAVGPIMVHVYRILENFTGTVGQSVIQWCAPVSDVPSSDDTSGINGRVVDFRITHHPA